MPPMEMSLGDAEAAMAQAAHVVEGEARSGGQEHFYLETQCVVATPRGEDGEMELTASSQAPTAVQVSQQ